jgi:hypothetical protein
VYQRTQFITDELAALSATRNVLQSSRRSFDARRQINMSETTVPTTLFGRHLVAWRRAKACGDQCYPAPFSGVRMPVEGHARAVRPAGSGANATKYRRLHTAGAAMETEPAACEVKSMAELIPDAAARAEVLTQPLYLMHARLYGAAKRAGARAYYHPITGVVIPLRAAVPTIRGKQPRAVATATSSSDGDSTAQDSDASDDDDDLSSEEALSETSRDDDDK